MNDDLLIIQCQVAYLLQAFGYDENARWLYSFLLQEMYHEAQNISNANFVPRDPTLATVLWINQSGFTLGHPTEMLRLYKRLKRVKSSLAFVGKLNTLAMFRLKFNTCLLALLLDVENEKDALFDDLSDFVNNNHSSHFHARFSSELQLLKLLCLSRTQTGFSLSSGLATLTKSTGSSSIATSFLSTIDAASVQLLVDEGKLLEAADLLASYKLSASNDACIASVIQLYVAAGKPEKAVAWVDGLKRSKTPLVGHLLAALFLSHGDQARAVATLLSVEGSDQERGVAIACASILARPGSQQQQAPSALVQQAEALLASSSSSSLHNRPAFTESQVDDLELTPVSLFTSGPKRNANTPAASSTPASAPGFSSNAAPGAPFNSKSLAKRRRILKVRAKRKALLLAKMKASGKYDVVGIPAPDPDRWIPKHLRRRGRKVAAAKYGVQAGKTNVSSGGAQGTAGLEKITEALDAKAKADASKAAVGSKPVQAPTPSSSTASKNTKNKKKK
jgi:hypothetical protein